jgi:hypothetical protein
MLLTFAIALGLAVFGFAEVSGQAALETHCAEHHFED